MHLSGLNGIRAIAALGVLFSHINVMLDRFGLPVLPGSQLANFGVSMFFTLSGFLITFLLLKEKEKTATVHIPKFYVRRILRIWPLYFFYLTIAVTLFFVESSYVSSNILYYIFFIPNVPFVLHTTFPLLNHYWSLGVEEQFYAFWPWVVKRIKELQTFFIAFIIGFLLLKVIVRFTIEDNTYYSFLHYTRFGCMGIGALAAFFYFDRKSLLQWMRHPVVEIATWAALLAMGLNKFYFVSIIDHELVALVTVAIIINQVDNPKPLFSLERRVFNYLGLLSFGIYVYNPMVIEGVAFLYKYITLPSETLNYVFIYTVVPLAVILVAHLSYHLLEKPFLKRKDKYAVVASSANSLTKPVKA